MKYFNSFLSYLILICLFSCTDKYKESKHIILKNGWKFKPGDNLDYASPYYNDSNWDSINTSRSWQKQGHNYVGFAWYRIKIIIPSSIINIHTDSLKFVLGQVKDGDQLFINGMIIGENNQVVPTTHKIDSGFTYKTSSGIRRYTLSFKDPRIKWDKENVVAIRVFDKGEKGGGGLIGGIPFIATTGLEDHIKFDNSSFYKLNPNGNLDTNLVMESSFEKPIRGDLSIKGRVIETGEDVFSANFLIELNGGESKLIPISLPMTMDQIQISISFREHQLEEIVRDTLIVPFVLVR